MSSYTPKTNTNLAPDGLPYHENAHLVGHPGEVEIIQFVRPNGRRRKMFCNVGEEYCKKAADMIIGAEWTGLGTVALYCKRKGAPNSDELIEIANNGPYPVEHSPLEKLKKLIDSVIDMELSTEEISTESSE